MLAGAIQKVVERRDLSRDEAIAAMEAIMTGEATPAQIACFLTALRMKGETVEEITGFALVMREKAVVIRPRRSPLVDTCGTGGDRLHTFNISTAAALVAAGAGIAIAKHGNRSVTSKSGSADVLEALGVNLAPEPGVAERCIEEIGIGFLFAPAYHPAMKHALPTRREIAIRTVFNILGPLTNPARAEAQVVGVYAAELTEPIAEVLGRLGLRRAMVVHGQEGLDEISTVGPTRVSELRDGAVATYDITPAELGVAQATLDDLRGGDGAENAVLLQEVLSGAPGPRRDIVLVNAAAALVVAGSAGDLREGIALAAHAIDEGLAAAKLDALRRFGQA
jgi:anthranilate phosphoribosyltransferase